MRCLLAGVCRGCRTGSASVGFDPRSLDRGARTRTCQLLVGLPDVVVLEVDACAGDAPLVVHVECPPDWHQDCPGCGLGQAATGGAPD